MPIPDIKGKVDKPVRVRLLFYLTGFNALSAQVLFLREFLVLFNGNELSIGVILAVWLLWTGIGSYLFGRIKISSGTGLLRFLVFVQATSVVLIPLTLAGIRYSRLLLHILPGESPGFAALFLLAGGWLSLFCLCSGGLFTLGSHYLKPFSTGDLSLAGGRFYWYETVGSALGGLILSVLLLPVLNAMQIAQWIMVLNGIAFFVYYKPVFGKTLSGWLIMAATAGFIIMAGTLDRISLKALWTDFEIIKRVDSPYANLTLLKYENELTLYSNGAAAVRFADTEQAEERVHFALLMHPAPRRVLLIGGGVGGTLEEILKHPSVQQIDYVETDPQIIRIAESASTNLQTLLDSASMINTYFMDGRLYLKQTHHRYDVILLAMGDPQTAALNRFYTREFFSLVKGRLAAGGLFSFQTVGADNYINDMQAEYLHCLNNTLRSVFKQTATIPGASIHFFAARGKQPLRVEADLLLRRLQERRIKTIYIREYYLPFRLMPDRIADLTGRVAPLPATRINSDFYPIGFYHYLMYWSGQHGDFIPRLLAAWFHFPFWQIVLFIAALLVAMMFLTGKKRGAYSIFAMFVMGFSMLALELVLLLAFQFVFGYVYRQLALLIGFFMAGMALGTLLIVRRMPAFLPVKINRLLRMLQSGLILYPPLLFGFIFTADQMNSEFWINISAYLAFPLSAFIGGALGGAQFPLISALYLTQSRRQNIGFIYAMDLAGALLAAIFVGVIYIPLYGLLDSLALIAVLNGALLLIGRKR
ncbi:MAG TPA: hypothetical protein ENK44_06365 [Caldithrix abyssi]|uniref:Polyamine aminopropyltransferase n=1 Tax=Caldithrix abyssi TaxID=187145 RepID=A0A7V4U106_CALAY|nr:hypothetical protein [Caldithrix abyssi]